jgi:hypothetical protein
MKRRGAKKVNYVLDADISDFFSKLDHSWLEKFLEHRIADRRVLRLIRKWVNAGVIEDGNWKETIEGSPQGGLCGAAHNPPYEQRLVMHSVDPSGLVRAVSGAERCA